MNRDEVIALLASMGYSEQLVAEIEYRHACLLAVLRRDTDDFWRGLSREQIDGYVRAYA